MYSIISPYPVDVHRRGGLIVLRRRGAFVLLLLLQDFPPGKGLRPAGRLLHERPLVREIDHVLRVEDVRPEGVDGVIPYAGVDLDEELPRARRVEHAGVGQEYVHQPRVLVQAQYVLALVRQQRANVDGEVLLVWKRREERQCELIVIGWLVEVRREAVVITKRFCKKEEVRINVPPATWI